MKRNWSTSKFADKIRGTAMPDFLPADEWERWETEAKKRHPFRFWVAEEVLSFLEKSLYYVPDKIKSINYYISNRWLIKTNSLTAHPRDIKPGSWCDLDDRILYCLFNELVNFIEIEKAWMHVVFSEGNRKKYRVPWWRAWSWRNWRSKDAGLDYLKWEMSLTYGEDEGITRDHPDYGKPTAQADTARILHELYIWWTEIRPVRPDPYDISGWTTYCVNRRKSGFGIFSDDNETDPKEIKNMLDSIQRIESYYDDEDTKMLNKLISIRRSLWT